MAEQGYNLEQTGPEVQGALNKIISISPATEEAPGLMSAEDKAKLDGITPANYATKDELASKVDKETGKGLSKNDYTDEDKALVGTIEGKQDTIQDLDGIRSGAALGATAYQKPATGIPATDLASAVQTSLGKADTALQQSDLEPIKEVIPDDATTQNKLADKAFVNSSIATATATFRGAYNLVTDLSLTTAATRAQIATALAGAVSTADNNDYAFVQVPTADVTPTEIARVERYKYNGSAWAFEYALNNSGFTASQWAALNSGITSGLVGKLSALPTNSELTTLLAGKQDTISDLSTIRTGATAGATAYQKPASGIPASDMASGVIPDVSGKADKSDTPRVVSFEQDLDELPGEIIEELRLGDIVSCLGDPYEVVVRGSNRIQLSVTGWFYEFIKTNDVWSYSTQGPDVESARFNKVTSLSAQSTDTQYPSAKCVYDAINPPIVTTQPVGGFEPGKKYRLGTLAGTVTFALANPTDNNIPNVYWWTFETGSTAPTVIWPSGVVWPDGFTPSVDAGKHYDVKVDDGYISYEVFTVPTA